MKTLFLTLNKKPFDIMVTGEKNKEYRVLNDWMRFCLFNKDNSPKHFDCVRFTTGYDKTRSYFIADFLKVEEYNCPCDFPEVYSNGFSVGAMPFGCFVIYLGSIIEVGNLKQI